MSQKHVYQPKNNLETSNHFSQEVIISHPFPYPWRHFWKSFINLREKEEEEEEEISKE